MRVAPWLRCFISLAIIVVAGCSTQHYRESADRQVYGIVSEKEQVALLKTNEFTIKTAYSDRDVDAVHPDEILADRRQETSLRLTLDEALRMAVTTSRTYQFRKEGLYLSALTLTRDRHDFEPRFFAGITPTVTREEDGDVTYTLRPEAGVRRAFRNGGALGLQVANDILRYFTGDPRRTAITTISANFFQPLLRGAGSRVAAENLTQSERNVIYEIRSFSRFQQTFALDVFAGYLRLLQQRDTVRNEYNNYQSLTESRKRAEARSQGLDVSKLQVDEARQNELSAKNRYLFAVESYKGQVDDFKMTLGLPAGFSVTVDDSVLAELIRLGLLPVDMSEADAFELALTRRLDFLNEVDRFEDSQRKVYVAANRLKPELNILVDASLDSLPPTDYAKFDLDQVRLSAGLQFDLPIDRVLERNDYRATLISFERQIRQLSLAIDQVHDEVREGLRTLSLARQSYQIQNNAVTLAEGRVDAARLSFEAGRIAIRDLLDAQQSLLSARNLVTVALVDYQVARLRFLINIGVLDTTPVGFWKEPVLAAKARPTAPETSPQPGVDDELVVKPEDLFGK